MHKHLELTPTLNISREEWLKIRRIGGSDVATILNLNPYTPALRLFHELIGLWKKEEIDNIHTYAGRVGEDFVEQYFWRFYDPENPDMETMLENAREGHQVRKARRFNYLIVNPDYPWLSANIDRLILKHKGNDQGVLEIKTALDNAMRKYDGGIPPQYILQMQTYMLITGLKYAELAILVNGRFFDVYRFDANETIQQSII
jgi:putative phage-type endonuclease